MADRKIYSPNIQYIVEKEIDRLNESSVSARNKELILSYRQHLSMKKSSVKTIYKLLYPMRKFALVLDKDFDMITIDDYERAINHFVEESDKPDATRYTYVRYTKQFFVWFQSRDQRVESNNAEVRLRAKMFYSELDKLRMKKIWNQADPSEILTDEDCTKIVENGCRTVQERAFVASLHGTGVRIGEHLGLKIRHVTLGENPKIFVTGKTGSRVIPLMPYVAEWLAWWIRIHPRTKDPEAYLWISESTNNTFEKPLNYIGATKLLERVFSRANARKTNNAHWFRHSRATLWAMVFPQTVLCKLMGWTLDSGMVRNYAHLSTNDVEQAFQRYYTPPKGS